MQTAKSHQALLLTTRPTTLFTNMTILHLLPKKSSRELKLKSACPHLHADRHTPSSRTHLICYSIFSFFVWCLGFCIWFDLLKPVVMGFQPVVNLFAFFFFFSLFDVWVSIWFDLLKLVVMDFQPVVNLCFSIFLFSFFLCLMFGFVHLVCTILMLGVMGFQPVVMKFTSLTSGFSTCSDLVK